MRKNIQVLMSTYNGQKYLSEQLDSILGQDYKELSILIRDDGSQDETLSILEKYSNQYANVEYYRGENIGVISSFFDLMKHADDDALYFALADQDDVWLKNKISRAVKILTKMGNKKVGLYCCRERLVDENLKELPNHMSKNKKKPGFGNALVENIATGGTCVMNKKLLLTMRRHVPEYTVMHDWWLYLTASCFGNVYFDDVPYIMYRQHANNVLGSRSNYLDEFRIRLKRFGNNKRKLSRQANAFNKSFHIEGENKELIHILLNYQISFKIRLIGLFSNRIYRQRREDNIIFKLLFLTNHI